MRKKKQRISNLKIIIAGDFNYYNYLWGGNGVTEERQGKVTPIINIMVEHGLTSLLKTGTVTREQAGIKLIINLILVTQNITNSTIFYKVHEVKHGSNHIIINYSLISCRISAHIQTDSSSRKRHGNEFKK